MQHPPFRAEHIGSLLRPAGLLELRRKHRFGQVSEATLRQAPVDIDDIIGIAEQPVGSRIKDVAQQIVAQRIADAGREARRFEVIPAVEQRMRAWGCTPRRGTIAVPCWSAGTQAGSMSPNWEKKKLW